VVSCAPQIRGIREGGAMSIVAYPPDRSRKNTRRNLFPAVQKSTASERGRRARTDEQARCALSTIYHEARILSESARDGSLEYPSLCFPLTRSGGKKGRVEAYPLPERERCNPQAACGLGIAFLRSRACPYGGACLEYSIGHFSLKPYSMGVSQ
jgi:hypothetical protein